MLRSCAAVVWMTCLLATTAWGRYLNEYDYNTMQMLQGIETEAVTATQPIENSSTDSPQVATSSELPPSTSAPIKMLDIPMPSDNNYNQYSAYGSGYGEEYNSGASGEESGSGLIGFDPVSEDGEGSGEGSGSFSPSDCPNLADGNYAMSACGHQFLTCSNGNPLIFVCPANFVYNAKLDMCDWPHKMGCEGSGEETASGEPVSEESGSGAASGEESSGEESGLTPIDPMILPLLPVEQSTTATPPVTTSTAQIIQEATTESSGLELVPSTSTAEPETSGIEETTQLAEGSSTEAETELSGEESGLTPIEQPATTTSPVTTSTAQIIQESTPESSGLEFVPSTSSTAEPETSGIEETTQLAEGSSAEAETELSGEESGLTPIEPMILPLPPVEQSTTATPPITTSTAQIIQEATTESSGLELVPSTSTAEPETSGIEETTQLAEGSSAEAETELSGEEGQQTTGEDNWGGSPVIPTVTVSATTEVPELSGEGDSGIETEQVQTTTAMPTSTSTQSDSTIISVVVHRGQLDGSLPSQSSDCSARADGNYELARCSARFVSCSNGISHLMNCPDQLVFNAQLNACDFPSALMCDGNSAGTGVESDTTCSSDGVFATESCSPRFHSCINGKLFDLSCDPGQLFSWARELCLPAIDFPECDLH